MTEITREPMHRRLIDLQGYLRSDGLWEVEAELQDTKTYEIDLMERGRVPVGGFLHHMRFVLVVNESLEIIDTRAEMLATPYPDCNGAQRQYKELIGLRIRSGWLEEAKQVIGKQTGCTHLTELLPAMATAVIQTIRGYQIQQDREKKMARKGKEIMLNSCYGFRQGGRAQIALWPDEEQ